MSTTMEGRKRHVFFIEPLPNKNFFSNILGPIIINTLSQAEINTSQAELELLAMQTGSDDRVFAANLETVDTFSFSHEQIIGFVRLFNRQNNDFNLSYLNEAKD